MRLLATRPSKRCRAQAQLISNDSQAFQFIAQPAILLQRIAEEAWFGWEFWFHAFLSIPHCCGVAKSVLIHAVPHFGHLKEYESGSSFHKQHVGVALLHDNTAIPSASTTTQA